MDFHRDIFNQNVKPFKEHKASFPVEMIERLILTTSKKGDVVLDPFMGSGTTVVAAAKHDRRYIGFKINPEYVALSRKRTKQWVGLKFNQDRSWNI